MKLKTGRLPGKTSIRCDCGCLKPVTPQRVNAEHRSWSFQLPAKIEWVKRRIVLRDWACFDRFASLGIVTRARCRKELLEVLLDKMQKSMPKKYAKKEAKDAQAALQAMLVDCSEGLRSNSSGNGPAAAQQQPLQVVDCSEGFGSNGSGSCPAAAQQQPQQLVTDVVHAPLQIAAVVEAPAPGRVQPTALTDAAHDKRVKEVARVARRLQSRSFIQVWSLDATASIQFKTGALERYVNTTAIFSLHYWVRTGQITQAFYDKALDKMLAHLPSGTRTGFVLNVRCMLCFSHDGTFVWQLSRWIVRGILTGPLLLHHIVLGIVTNNHHKRLNMLFGDKGLPGGQDGVDLFVGRWFRFLASNPDRKGLAFGLRGSARAVLNQFSFNHVEATRQYAQYSLDRCEAAWMALFRHDLDSMSIDERNSHTIRTLERHFSLNADLISVGVARLLEYIDPRLFNASRWIGIGERARWNLQSLLVDGASRSEGALQQALCHQAVRTAQQLPKQFVKILGPADAAVVADAPMPLGILQWDHRSLHQHLNCEQYRVEHPETGMERKCPSPAGEWLSWVEASLPAYSRLWAARQVDAALLD